MKRVGGGFGGKIVRASFVAAGCAVGAYTANRPVRVVLDMETNMQMIGKRLPYLMRYEVLKLFVQTKIPLIFSYYY